MSKTEKAQEIADTLAEILGRVDPAREVHKRVMLYLGREDLAVLRHLIAEARRCERVREWKDADAPAIYDWPEVRAYERAQYDVNAILSAPDAETKEESRG